MFPQEPPSPSERVLSLDNVVLTAHLAGSSRETRIKQLRNAFDNVLRVARGERPDFAGIARYVVEARLTGPAAARSFRTRATSGDARAQDDHCRGELQCHADDQRSRVTAGRIANQSQQDGTEGERELADRVLEADDQPERLRGKLRSMISNGRVITLPTDRPNTRLPANSAPGRAGNASITPSAAA